MRVCVCVWVSVCICARVCVCEPPYVWTSEKCKTENNEAVEWRSMIIVANFAFFVRACTNFFYLLFHQILNPILFDVEFLMISIRCFPPFHRLKEKRKFISSCICQIWSLLYKVHINTSICTVINKLISLFFFLFLSDSLNLSLSIYMSVCLINVYHYCVFRVLCLIVANKNEKTRYSFSVLISILFFIHVFGYLVYACVCVCTLSLSLYKFICVVSHFTFIVNNSSSSSNTKYNTFRIKTKEEHNKCYKTRQTANRMSSVAHFN